MPRLLTVCAAVVLSSALAFYAAGPAQSEGRRQPNVVIIHHPGPNWKAGVPYGEQDGLQAHIEHYRKLFESGQLLMGGPFLDESGGMMVSTEGASIDDLKAFAADDPAVKSGLLTADVKPWFVAMKK